MKPGKWDLVNSWHFFFYCCLALQLARCTAVGAFHISNNLLAPNTKPCSDYQNEKLRARSVPANVALVAGTQTMERTQPTRDPYQINFEHVKKYLFTAAKDPCEIPEDRRDVLYGEFAALTHIELRLRKRGSAPRLSQLVLLHAFLSFMYAIFFVNIEPGIYYLGFSVLLLWVLFIVPSFLMGVPASSKMSPAQRIYVETERFVQERQRMLSTSGHPSSST